MSEQVTLVLMTAIATLCANALGIQLTHALARRRDAQAGLDAAIREVATKALTITLRAQAQKVLADADWNPFRKRMDLQRAADLLTRDGEELTRAADHARAAGDAKLVEKVDEATEAALEVADAVNSGKDPSRAIKRLTKARNALLKG